MKIIYSFMIGLILFNFYACSNQTYSPKRNNLAKSNLEITYLDTENKPTESKTDTILMKLKDDESGFIMVSKMTNKNECIDYLIDTKNDSTISMFYTNIDNQKAFPHKIIIVQGEESMVGYTSKYREETKDFDIIWEMSDGSTTNYETFANIPITAVFNHATTPGVEADTDYQIKTLKVSIRIADAINKYIDDNFDDNPLLRGKRWNAFCNFWKNVFKPIVKVVTIIVAVFVPPVAAIIDTVVNVADAIINVIDNAINKTETTAKASSGIKKLYILKKPNNREDNNRYTDKEIIYLTNRGDTRNIIFEVSDDAIKDFKGRISIPEEKENEVGLAGNYYGFKDVNKATECSINSQGILLDYATLKNTINLLVNKKLNKIGHNVYINIELKENIFINEKATNSFQLMLQKDLIE